MMVLSVMFKTHNNMPIPINVQCVFTKHIALRPSLLQYQYVRQCVRTNVKLLCLSIYDVIYDAFVSYFSKFFQLVLLSN